MNGLLIYTRHLGQPGYDDVTWVPAHALTEDEAKGIALLKLNMDPLALSVQITNDSGSMIAIAQAA